MENKAIRRTLANNVRARMGEVGLDTQAKLAAKAGMAQSHISRLLDSSSGVTVDVLHALAVALKCEPWELLVDDDATRRSVLARIIGGR